MSTGRSRIGWINLKDSVFIAVLAGLSFIVENSLGLILLPLTSSIPLIGGTLSAIPDGAIIFLGAYLVPRRGAIFLFAIILLSLSIVTPGFGPPGIYKIVIGVALGLLFEILLLVRDTTAAHIIITGVVFSASIPVTYFAWVWFGLPGVTLLRPKLPILMGIYLIEGILGALLGNYLYRSRLSQLSAVRRIRSVS
ncbi:MAG TPA: hypothetical protein VNW97_14870 [Candidatus Saccharimonadales bacterium]|jgi:hypothetical protein|nr:hypothetical protein [Candidatus Saccharimonadales bacterium]